MTLMPSPTATPLKRNPKAKRGVDKYRLPTLRTYDDTGSAAKAATVSVDKPLSDQQKRFVSAWAQGDSKEGAAVRAGYADAQVAYRLARMPNVLALKAEYEKKYESESQMDRKQVMDGLKEAIEMAKLMSEPASMIAGWREIGKMCGYYAPVEARLKVDITGNVTMQRLTQLSDSELLEMIEKGASAQPQPQLTNGS